MLEYLINHAEWLHFLDFKIAGGHLSKTEETALTAFIEKKEYLPVAKRLLAGGFFSVPEAVRINKSFSDKKRTVFQFDKAENTVMKMLAWLLFKYDGIFHHNLYSFRQRQGVKKAVCDLIYSKSIADKYACKLDISDYFGSVPAKKILPMLKRVLADDTALYRLMEAMLLNPYAIVDGCKVEMNKGILAGCPLSGFLANLYLTELDGYFEAQGVRYARYSDDIIFFAESEEALERYRKYVIGFLTAHGLCINERKTETAKPHEAWTFLGFQYHGGRVDIAPASKDKLKKKMRRKMRALERWKNKKNAAPERAVRAYIRYFNQKLYDNPVHNEMTWCRWYFPLISTDKSLKEIDLYMQQCIRTLATGKRNRTAYNFRYETMRDLGYRPLVSSYYRFRKNIEKSVDNSDVI